MPVLRPGYAKTNCFACPKIPESVKKDNDPRVLSKKHAQEWTQQSIEIYEHFLECRATGVWPLVGDEVDPIVRRHARILTEFLDRMDRMETGGHFDELASLLMMARKR